MLEFPNNSKINVNKAKPTVFQVTVSTRRLQNLQNSNMCVGVAKSVCKHEKHLLFLVQDEVRIEF